MNKPEELWSIAVNEGLNNYDRNGQPEIQTLFLVGASKSVRLILNIYIFCKFINTFLSRVKLL